MTEQLAIFGMAARFDDEALALETVRAATDAGWRVEAYTPYPVPGMPAALRHRDPWPARALTAGAVGGFAAAMLVQWYATAVDYPINVGGRDLVAWAAFAIPSFELGVLAAVVCGVGAMLVRNRLPKLYHPIFWYPDHWRSSSGSYVVCIENDCDAFDPNAVRDFLRRSGGQAIREVTA
ncbi:DUF3341 domain-containing protein [Caenispirillum bisanense]|uniref:Quinol:cytochrome c oxidoreductase membrane protein n=1 Tax=Caenispirillum bisanense TaxID=414052 RepID=A0A286G0D7_9PROT|nr:DUF3341 domain-containing protein [Caenispirillum bisanense]SOD88928.1 quinol:cytochrome c oxidoreductase membrane protein [Caenispirillum bisanense]